MLERAYTPHRLRLVVLLSGGATMALQMATVRLLAPWVGSSSIVWATIIGLSLLAMSAGYALGGRLVDRRVDGPTLARTLLAAAVLVAAIPLAAPYLLPHVALGIESAAWAGLVGSALAYGVLVLAPALLLGVTPPYAIRLAIDDVARAGATAGRLYALSTVGSIIGTLLTALVLVQWIGTRTTLFAIAATLLVAASVARGAHPRVGRVTAAQDAAPAVARGVLSIRIGGLIVLIEGMALMATEMSVARLVAPFFGASHAVWAVIIATVMGSIALGSRLGGAAADRWPAPAALAALLAASGVSVAVLPFVASPVMRLSTGGIDAVDVSTVVSAFVGTMLVLIVPITLLGMVPPWVLRVAVPDVARAGRTAGRMYALSTLGALVGTFASVLVLIPAIGTRRTMLLMAGALVLLAMGIMWSAARPAPRRLVSAVSAATLVVVALAFAPTGLVKPLDDGGVLAEEESRYQFIQVVEDVPGGRRLLQLNEGWAVHSIWDPQTVLTGGIWDHFLVLPALLERENAWDSPGVDANRRAEQRGSSDSSGRAEMLVIGSAAGTAKRAFSQLRPGVGMTSVELDEEVTTVGRRFFELEGDVVTADGRPFLERSNQQWDVIHVDAYRQPYIPFYLTTREFFELGREHLTAGGVLSINVGSTPADPRINEAVAATMRAVFPLVVRYRAERYNEVIVGVNDPNVSLEQLSARIRSSDLAVGDAVVVHARDAERLEVEQVFRSFAVGMFEVAPDPDRVLTDDRAPVEWMTDRMIFGEAG